MAARRDPDLPPRGWRLRRRLLQDPIALAAPLRTDLSHRPRTQVILAPRGVDRTVTAMVWLTAAVVVAFLGVAMAERLWTLALIAAAVAVLLGAVAWLTRARAAMSWSATWHRNRVVVADGRYGRTRTWEEPLASFDGVERRCAYLSQGNDLMPGEPVHGVLLAHPSPHKSVLLHVQRQPIDDDVLVGYAHQLGTTVIP